MSEITTIGLDLAKHVFQVHGIDAQGTTVLRKRLRRGQVLAFFSRIPRCDCRASAAQNSFLAAAQRSSREQCGALFAERLQGHLKLCSPHRPLYPPAASRRSSTGPMFAEKYESPAWHFRFCK
jgi:hypothetical protein